METHDKNDRQSLVDVKGLGKQPTFKDESRRFTEWLRKTTGFCGSLRTAQLSGQCLSGWNNVITNDALEQQFGPLSEEPVDDIMDKSEHVHAALLALTEGESFDIFFNTIRSRGAAMIGHPMGSSEWRQAQSASAANLGSRSVQTA